MNDLLDEETLMSTEPDETSDSTLMSSEPDIASTPPTEDEAEEFIQPEVIGLMSSDLLALPYDEGISKLKEMYSTINWTDKEKAAQEVAEVSSLLNRKYGVEPEVKLDTDATYLGYKLLDTTLNENQKLEAIEDWRLDAKEKLFNTDNPDQLISGDDQEKTIDSYAHSLRRQVVAGDVGWFKDSMARGVETAIAPLAGTADLFLGTELEKKLKTFTQDYQNPEYDNTVSSEVAYALGGLSGFVASSINPVTAGAYLGATISQQGKSIYDTAFNETQSESAATQALIGSAPGILIGSFADRIIGGSAGKLIKGQKGYQSVLGSAAMGAGGNLIQSGSTGLALSEATGNEDFLPTQELLAIQTIVGGAIGGAVGAASKYLVQTPEEIAISRARAQLKKALTGTTIDNNEPSFINSRINNPNDKFNTSPDNETTKPSAEDTESFVFKSDVEEAPAFTPDEYYNQEILKDASNAKPRTIIPISKNFTPQALLNEIVMRLDGFLGSAPLIDNLLGFYEPVNNRIILNRSVFKDPKEARATMAHELGHFMDAKRIMESNLADIISGRVKGKLSQKDASALYNLMFLDPLINKFIPINKAIAAGMDIQAFEADALKLSLEWRPEPIPLDRSSPGRQAYRRSSPEIQADVFSALINSPEYIEANYPNIWGVFNKGMEDSPDLKNSWKDIEDLRNNPDKVFSYTLDRLKEGRVKEAKIVKDSVEKTLKDKRDAFVGTIKNLPKAAKDSLVNAFSVAAKVRDEKGLNEAERTKRFELYQDLYAKNTAYQQLHINYDVMLNKWINDFDRSGLAFGAKDKYDVLNTFLVADRIINDTNQTIENIKGNFNTYSEAGMLIEDTFRSIKTKAGPIDTRFVDSLFKDMVFNTTPEALEQSLAKFHGAYFTKKDRAQLIKEISALDERQVPTEIAEAAIDVLKEGAFDVRRYLANPGMDILDAQRFVSLLKNDLGADRYKEFKGYVDKFHEIIMDPLIEVLKDSELYRPELLNKIELNKRNYATFNVLKHFEKNPEYKAFVKKQVGTLSEIGDSLSSTIEQAKTIYTFAQYQKSQNAAVNLALRSGDTVTMISPKVKPRTTVEGEKVLIRENVFELKEKLQKDNPDKSYLIKSEEGTPTLYEVNNPRWADMFEKSDLESIKFIGPTLNMLDGVTKFFFERQLKTILNPVFWLRQYAMDIQNEAIYARSFALPGVPFHISKDVRAQRREGRRLAKLIQEGKFTDEIKTLFEGGAIALNHGGEFGINPFTLPAENVIRQKLGVDIPNESEIGIVNNIHKDVAKALDKSFFGKGIKVVTKPLVKAGEALQKRVEYDELTTKITGYLIAKNLKGLSDAEAIAAGREHFGTPDVFGGGIEATSLNKLFLFYRAHVNGLRSVFNQFKNDKFGYGAQFAYHKLLPRVLTSSALMAPIISTMFGEEEGAIYTKFLDKVSEFDKASKLVIPLGFMDDNGVFKGFNVKSKEINPDWKSRYLRLPLSREMFTLDTLITPEFKALEDLVATGTVSGKYFAQRNMEALGSAFVGNLAPSIKGAINLSRLLGGYNPYDFYRGRGILPKDVQEAGDVVDKLYEYLTWSAYSTAPGIFSKSLETASQESLNPIDYIAKAPITGSMLKGFVGTSNYGEYELGQRSQQAKTELDSGVRLHLQGNSKLLYNEYRKYSALVSRLGKDWEKEITDNNLKAKIHMLYKWKANAYRHGFNEMRSSFEQGDDESLSRAASQLEGVSTSYGKILGLVE